MNKRRNFLLASGALVSSVASPTLLAGASAAPMPRKGNDPGAAGSAATAQNKQNKYKVSVTYIPLLANLNNVLSGSEDKKEKEKEITVIVEASDIIQAEADAITKNVDGGFFQITNDEELFAVPMNSVTRYSVTKV